jgi:hypothetical protein
MGDGVIVPYIDHDTQVLNEEIDSALRRIEVRIYKSKFK